jgi:hypothetical protein
MPRLYPFKNAYDIDDRGSEITVGDDGEKIPPKFEIKLGGLPIVSEKQRDIELTGRNSTVGGGGSVRTDLMDPDELNDYQAELDKGILGWTRRRGWIL